MKRRQFLTGAGSGLLSPLAWSSSSLPRLGGNDSFVKSAAWQGPRASAWSLRLQGQVHQANPYLGDIIADIFSYSFVPAKPVDVGVPIAIKRHLQGRAFVAEIPAIGELPQGEADFTLRFLYRRNEGRSLNMDIGTEHSIFVVPGNGVAEKETWKTVGMSFEEWTTRALLGAWLNEFPHNVDRADVMYVTGKNCLGGHHPATICAISLATNVFGDGSETVREAVRDVRESLQLRGYSQDSGEYNVFATFHGPDNYDLWGSALELVMRHWGDSGISLFSQDWIESLARPFVSVMGIGFKSGHAAAMHAPIRKDGIESHVVMANSNHEAS